MFELQGLNIKELVWWVFQASWEHAMRLLTIGCAEEILWHSSGMS